MNKYFYFFAPNTKCACVVALSEKKQVPFSMAIGNGQLRGISLYFFSISYKILR